MNRLDIRTHDGRTHSSLPPGGSDDRLPWRDLLAPGISGGLRPCPAVLPALRWVVALGRAGVGPAVVMAFGLDLAALTKGRLRFLYAVRFLEQRRRPCATASLMRFAPVAAVLAVTASSALIGPRAGENLWKQFAGH